MNVFTLDLNFRENPHTVAAYLAVGPRGPILIDTGPSSVLETMQARLAGHNYSVDDIQHVFLTHIHMDHAGAAGWWAQRGAHIYVHPNGAKHLIDPSKLLASAERIYGERMNGLWGPMLPAPRDHVTIVEDGEAIQVEGLKITAIDTPGHAYHHHSFRIGDVAFTGDASGIRLPNSTFLTLPSPPPEFSLESWHTTLSKLQNAQFTTIFPTHYGGIQNVREHLEELASHLSQCTEFVRDRLKKQMERGEVTKEFVAWNRERATAVGLNEEAFQQYEKANPFFMSVDGLMRYWSKKWETDASA